MQIDHMGNCGNCAPQHLLFYGGGHSDIFYRIFQTKAAVEDVFNFRAKVIICNLIGIGRFLPKEEFVQIFQRYSLLKDRNADQIADMVCVILLLHRIDNQSLLDVVAHHRAGDLNTAQRFEALIDIFDSLLQIKTDIWQLSITRKMKCAPLSLPRQA